MYAHHTTARSARIAVFDKQDDFENVDGRTLEYTNGEPLVVAREDKGGWLITVNDPRTEIRYPDLKIVGTVGNFTPGAVSNICLAIAHGVIANRTEASTVVTI